MQSSNAKFLESQTVFSHPLLDQLDSTLRDVVPPEPVQFGGEWMTQRRRTYRSQAQSGSGSGPYVEVADVRWRGVLTSPSPIGAIGFLLTPQALYWTKAPEVSLTLPVDISLHAYAEYTIEGATFTARVAGASLPGVPVPGSPDLASVCTVRPDVLTTGRVAWLARGESAAVFVLVLQRVLLKVGRKRLWRVRDDIASALPADMRELLTRRRTGAALVAPGT